MRKYFYYALNVVTAVLLNATFLQAASQRIDLEEQETTADHNLGMHGFFDLTFKNDYITPRGLLVTNDGVTIQILAGGVMDLYSSKDGCITNVSLTAGVWNDLWSNQKSPSVGAWNEMDWFCGFIFTTRNNWKFSTQFLQFLSPPGNFAPENNIEFLLTYEDGKDKRPFSWNPYIKLFWTVSGDSTVVVGRKGKTYDVEIGLLPSWNLKTGKWPATLFFPTWITIGPASFWNGGKDGLKKVHQNYGVFSTGADLKVALPPLLNTGTEWYIHVGGQYYCLLNTNLLQAQVFTLGLSNYKKGHRNVGVAQAGVGFQF